MWTLTLAVEFIYIDTDSTKALSRNIENKNMMRGQKFWHSQKNYDCYHMAKWNGKKRVLWHVVKMRKHKMWAGVFFKRVANKGPSMESRASVTQVTFTAVKQSTNGLWAHWAMMAARPQQGREREWGIYWDIMDTGDEGSRVRRAGVEECSYKSYPCVTLKPNTYLLSCKMAVSAWPPLMGTVELPVQTYSAPVWVTPSWCCPML